MGWARSRRALRGQHFRGVKSPVVIAIDGTSASGKSTNARLVAQALDYIYVDTGAMYRTLAWHCLQKKIDVNDPKAVAGACRRWKTSLDCKNQEVHLLVEGYYPAREIRTVETTAAVPFVAAVPAVRRWMKSRQRQCSKFGNLVMEGRDIGTNIFPETEFKFYLDACPVERSERRASQGIQEDVTQRDRHDSQRAASPLMIALGATVINNSGLTSKETSTRIIEEVRRRLSAQERDGKNGSGGK